MLTSSLTSPRNIARKNAPVEVHHRLSLTRDFGLVWLSQLVSQVGDGISKLALLWFVYSITGSPLKTTAIGLLQTIPPLVCGPLIGVLVDWLPKKLLLIGSNVFRAILIGFVPCVISVDTFDLMERSESCSIVMTSHVGRLHLSTHDIYHWAESCLHDADIEVEHLQSVLG